MSVIEVDLKEILAKIDQRLERMEQTLANRRESNALSGRGASG